jgi:uncharacterized protein (TIGR02271 family)
VNQSTDRVTQELELPETASDLTLGSRIVTGTSEFVVPVVREELDVRKEVLRTGTVRVRKIVHEAPESVSELLTSENIEIERIPMDVLVDAAPPIRMEGDVTVISIVEEVLVVTKQLRLKEELRIAKRQSRSEYRQEVTLRSEEVIVERLHGETSTQA